jgi:homoserine O-acetyltransferase
MAGELRYFTCDQRLDAGVDVRMHLAYRTFGTLNAAGSNAVLLCGYYTGTTESYDPWLAPGGCFAVSAGRGDADDSSRRDDAGLFVVTCGLFGNGESYAEAPVADAPAGIDEAPGPNVPADVGTGSADHAAFGVQRLLVSIADNVRVQRRLLDAIGVHHLLLVGGWSIGGMQALAWSRLYPTFCSSVLAECATLTCHPVNRAFLLSIRPILCRPDRSVDESLRARDAFGRAYMPWALSGAYFTDGEFRQFGYASIDEELAAWGLDHQRIASHDLLAMLDTWLTWRDCPQDPCGGDCGVRPHVVMMPSTTDRYFLESDARADARSIGADVVPLVSTLGHVAGRPGVRAAETTQIADVAHVLLVEARSETRS